MSGVPGPAGTVGQALANADALLRHAPELALQQVAAILEVEPREARAHLVQGLALGALGRGEAAVAALRRAVQLAPGLGDAWRALADHLAAMGDAAGSAAAGARHIQCATHDPRLLRPALALAENRIPEAEALLRAHLKDHPTDAPAIRMFAEVAARLGRYQDAENLLRRCLELAPGFLAARQNLAAVLYRHDKPAEALAEIEPLLVQEPRNPSHRALKAALLGRIGEYAQAIELYRGVLEEYPTQPRVWMSAGHALKTAGRQEEGIAAYRRSLELAPGLGEAWWSLANLKTVRFSAADVAAMHRQLERTDIGAEDRFHLHFALGKALEDAAEYAASFEHYAEGNRLRRRMVGYSAADNAAHVRRSRQLYTRAFFAARAGQGAPAPDPIFIVGLPRSGSTLLEQILASHSQVEGTMELPDLVALARELGGPRRAGEASRYPEVLATLPAAELRALGERYLERTRIQRKSTAPFFIDKLPNNFAHIGLIHLILPNARIVDARRHPMACCFSGFKQHFARGQNFTYSLEEIGRYYRDYVELMAHFDAVLPGRVHRVLHEDMVEDTEAEVRRLLAYCGLPFEEACLQFHRTVRAVRTASSEQVRQPIFREGLEQWRHFEAWLAPLKEALGPVLEAYPSVPDFADWD